MKKLLLLIGFLCLWAMGFSQNFNLMKKITPPDIDSARVAADCFGFSVAISGNYAVVGAHQQGYDSAGGETKTKAGAAYVFERTNGGVWGYIKKLTPPNMDSARVASDGFGRSVAISGDYIAVGAAGNNGAEAQDWDSAGGNYKSNAGAVYIFERQNGNWGYVKKLTPPNVDSARVAGDLFGGSVGISGNYLIVGAINQDYDSTGGNPISNAGAAYIFERRNGEWGYAKKLSSPANRAASDLYAYSVAISGDYAIVGAPQQDYDSVENNYKSNAGAAYMYERVNGVWGLAKKITPPNTDSARVAGDLLGYKVAIDGTTALVGAFGQDYDSIGTTLRSSAGAAYVFERNSGEWGYIKKLTPDNATGNRTSSNQFSVSMGISGNNIAIGANQNAYDSALSNFTNSAGTVYVFEKRNGVWGYAKKLSTDGTNGRNVSDFFGSSVAISGNYIIGGCVSTGNSGHDYDSAGGNFKSNAGAAFIFENMLSLEYNSGWVGTSPSSATENYNCYIRGGTATIAADAKINSLVVDNGTTATLSGNLSIANNYTNNGTVSGGAAVLTGNSSQKIMGNGSVQNFTMDNAYGGKADVLDSLKINGVLTLTAGTLVTNNKLVLEATDSNVYGQIAGTGSGSLSGNLTAEMLVTGGGAGWRPICSPVSGATLNDINDDVNLNFGTPDNSYATIYYLDESAAPYWAIPTGTGDAFGDGGYSVYMGGSSSWANPLPLTLDIQGAYRGTSDYTYSNLTRTGSLVDTTGWHYIANPWPSGFLWDDANITINSGGIQGSQVWMYNQSAGAYQVFDGTDNGVIPPFHPLLVEVTANNTELVLKNSARTTDSLTIYLGKTGLQNLVEIQVTDANGKSDKAKFYTDDNATNGYDVMDGNKRTNLNAPNLYFVLEGRRANKEVWNTIPAENEALQLNFEAKTTGQYTFTLSTENLEGTTTVELIDKQSGIAHNIEKGDYTFNHDLNNAANRFELKFSKKSTSTNVEEAQTANVYVGSTGNTITIGAQAEGNYTVEVYDMLGRSVQAPVSYTSNGSNTQSITVNGVQTGYYIVKITGNNVYKTAKVFLK
jgi:hypothetical protein